MLYTSNSSSFQTTTSTSLNHTSSTSNHQHTHHHTHHHERLSPANQLLGMRHMHSKMPQANPHHLMIQPPSMGHHGPPLGPPSMASSSLDQLRAHAAQAAANMQNQSAMHTPTSSPMPVATKPPIVPEEIKVEPDPEPVVEEESQTSPPGPPRGPSPEPRIEDTECHRSQSAM